jgi:hypothetical protein
MRHVKILLVAVFFFALASIPSLAQQNDENAPPKDITGTVVSFNHNILDLKPPTNEAAVWITIPDDMKVDRDTIKKGVNVSVEAKWIGVCYLATAPPEVVAAK